MSPTTRALVVTGVIAVALAAAWVARRGAAFRRRRAVAPASVRTPVLFTSRTCSTCDRVRHIVAGLDLGDVAEVVWEERPDLFAEASIERVPVLMWTDRSGTTWRVDGVAGPDRMRRWLKESKGAPRDV